MPKLFISKVLVAVLVGSDGKKIERIQDGKQDGSARSWFGLLVDRVVGGHARVTVVLKAQMVALFVYVVSRLRPLIDEPIARELKKKANPMLNLEPD